MDDVLRRIRRDLQALRDRPRSAGVFGSESHGFAIEPPLAEEAVRHFEQTHRISLPADYRRFLIEVGNGGAGPAYGLFRLGEMDEGHDQGPWHEGDGFVGILAEPWPHTGPWNDLTGRPDDSEFDEDPESEERYLAWDAIYYTPDRVNGAIPICHLGCAYRQWLVVTGPEAGHVWCDDRADEKGLYPLEQDGRERVTFLDWYCSWLAEAIEQTR